MRLTENEIILIDSLHGLFPGMMSAIPDERKFKLYIETLIQLKGQDGHYVRWTDLRLMRRMLRDAAHRSYDPQRTLEHWHYVRSSELRHIIPVHQHDRLHRQRRPALRAARLPAQVDRSVRQVVNAVRQ